MSYYDDLGIPKESSPEEIHKAYRKKAMETHPDKGGDAQSFSLILKAYKILSDPDSKEHYDRTGEEKSQKQGNKIIDILKGLLTEAFCADNISNPIDYIKKKINNSISEHTYNINQIKLRTEKLKKKYDKLTSCNKESDILNLILDHLEEGMQQLKMAKEAEEEAILTETTMLEMLKDIKYVEDVNKWVTAANMYRDIRPSWDSKWGTSYP